MKTLEDISIIIPTTASNPRAPLLMRALESLQNQTGARVFPIVVVNGNKYSKQLVDALNQDRRLRCLYREEGSAPRAIAAGREVVETRYFCVLDDDDVYLPNAFESRVSALRDDESVDVVITNGYRWTDNGKALNIEGFAGIGNDPAASLMENNWLPSCGGTFRTTSVGPEFFSDAPAACEWTYIGLRLALTRKIQFLNTETFAIYVDSPGSLSKSKWFVEQLPVAIETMMKLGAPAHIQKALRKKHISALHQLCVAELSEGNRAKAWRWHLESLRSIYGAKYLSFTRQLLLGSLSINISSVI